MTLLVTQARYDKEKEEARESPYSLNKAIRDQVSFPPEGKSVKESQEGKVFLREEFKKTCLGILNDKELKKLLKEKKDFIPRPRIPRGVNP